MFSLSLSPSVHAAARQFTNCHRQLQAIRFIPERPRSVYVVRRGMINQRRVASHPCPPARSWTSIASTIGELRPRVPQRECCGLRSFLPSFSPSRGPKLFIAAGLMSSFCVREHEKFRGPHAARRIREHF